MILNTIFQWVGFITLLVIVISAGATITTWLILKTLDNIKFMRLWMSTYWKFYQTIKHLPPGEYRQYRVTWDRTEGCFTDAEGIR